MDYKEYQAGSIYSIKITRDCRVLYRKNSQISIKKGKVYLMQFIDVTTGGLLHFIDLMDDVDFWFKPGDIENVGGDELVPV